METAEQNQAQARINSAREEITKVFRDFPELRKGYRDLIAGELIASEIRGVDDDADRIMTLLFNE